jgi:hypothetical protein
MKAKQADVARLLKSARIQNAIAEAVQTAVEDYRQYIEYGNPSTDYGKEWPVVCRNKIEQLNAWRDVCDALGLESLVNECRVTAATYRGMILEGETNGKRD